VKSFITAIAAFLFLLPCLAFGNQIAILRNGFSISHQKHQVIGNNTRLYTSTDGSYVDVPTEQIDHFEEDATPIPLPAKPLQPAAILPVSTTLPVNATLNSVVSEVSGRHNLDPDLVNSVIHAESGFNTRAVSRKGAQGLMQLMPKTAATLGVANAFDPQSNVEAGTRYLRDLLEKYNFDLAKALAAYNAGPLRVQQYGGVPPYYETRAYVARIIRDYNRKKLAETQAAKLTKKTPVHPAHQPLRQPLFADSKQQGADQATDVHAGNKTDRESTLR
jgi:hypothetical protein